MENKYRDPDNLGGLGNMLPAEVLKLLHEMLERMHQTGFNNHGSKIQMVYVAPGAQHVDTIQGVKEGVKGQILS